MVSVKVWVPYRFECRTRARVHITARFLLRHYCMKLYASMVLARWPKESSGNRTLEWKGPSMYANHCGPQYFKIWGLSKHKKTWRKLGEFPRYQLSFWCFSGLCCYKMSIPPTVHLELGWKHKMNKTKVSVFWLLLRGVISSWATWQIPMFPFCF